ncbi:MAG: hypothetical protein WCF99_05640 [Chloroflexales bacterium]
MEEDLQALVGRIHAMPPRVVYAFAGAGSLALWWLHRVAGSSRTLLEAIDCYAPRSLEALLGAPPTQSVSAEVARAMAVRAYTRASLLSDRDGPLLGVGCTAALATDRERRGADRCFLAIREANVVYGYTLSMNRERGREEQEDLVSRLVIGAIAVMCGVRDDVRLALRSDEDLFCW